MLDTVKTTLAVETEMEEDTSKSKVGEGNLDVTVSEFYKPLMSSNGELRMKQVRELDFMGVLDDDHRNERFKRAKVNHHDDDDDDVSEIALLEALFGGHIGEEEIETKSGWIDASFQVDLNSMPKQQSTDSDSAPADYEEEKLDRNVHNPPDQPKSLLELSHRAGE